jgi:hypothetical protein
MRKSESGPSSVIANAALNCDRFRHDTLIGINAEEAASM